MNLPNVDGRALIPLVAILIPLLLAQFIENIRLSLEGEKGEEE